MTPLAWPMLKRTLILTTIIPRERGKSRDKMLFFQIK